MGTSESGKARFRRPNKALDGNRETQLNGTTRRFSSSAPYPSLTRRLWAAQYAAAFSLPSLVRLRTSSGTVSASRRRTPPARLAKSADPQSSRCFLSTRGRHRRHAARTRASGSRARICWECSPAIREHSLSMNIASQYGIGDETIPMSFAIPRLGGFFWPFAAR